MRIDKHEYCMLMAKAASMRSTCMSRKVGAVLCDENYNILSTGYNGSPRKNINCSDAGVCYRSNSAAGKDLDLCIAVHAEINALIKCHDVDKINSIFTTTYPCIQCLKAILNTNCKQIFFLQDYFVSDAANDLLRYRKDVSVFQLKERYSIQEMM